MIEEPKDWGLIAKIAGALGGAGFLVQLIKTWRSPKEARETGEQHYSELFLKEIQSLRDDLAQIRTNNEAALKVLIEDYEKRLSVYREASHRDNNRASKFQGILYRLGWDMVDDGNGGDKFVRISIEKGE